MFSKLTDDVSHFKLFLNFNFFLIIYVLYVSFILDKYNLLLFDFFSLKETILILALLILTVSTLWSYYDLNGFIVLVLFFLSEISLMEFNILYLTFNIDFSLLVNLFTIGAFIFYLNIQVKKFYSLIFFLLSCFVYIVLEILSNNFDSKIVLFLLLLIGMLFYLSNIYEKKYLSNIKEIEKKNKELAEITKQNNMFLSKISHNIRTPLNIVINQVFMLKEKIFDSDPHCILYDSVNRCSFIDNEIVREVSNLNTTANQLLLTVNEILDYQKTISGKNSIEQVNFDFNQLLMTINEIFDPLIKQKNLNFSIIKKNTKLEDSVFYGNMNHLKQILINLIDNAIKYTIEGEVRLIVDLKEINNNTILQIDVSDTGIGIPEGNIKDLFKPFSQIKNSLDVTGSGLGLAIIQELIDLNKGKIFIESVENEGTTFKLEYPVKNNSKFQMDKPSSIVQVDSNNTGSIFRKTIDALIADDYQENHSLIKELLKKYPINIDFVLNGEDALEKISNKKYDIIFLDIRMPKKNGMETIVESKNIESNPNSNTPFIALTANSLKEEISFYKELGFTNVVTKPFSRNDLIQVIYSNFDYVFLNLIK